MSFKLIKKLDNGVRIGELTTPHGVINTPFFMPVGTVGSVKGVSPDELEQMGAEIILSNTYHLYLRPGEKLIKELGGLHKFMGWNKPILTDSGGYQVFSLARGNNHNKNVISSEVERSLDDKISPTVSRSRNDKLGLVKISEEGVLFKSHLDGSKHLFTPEKVIDIQLDLGVDILMPLDVCPSGKASKEEVKNATDLSIVWAKRAKEYFDKKVASRQVASSENSSSSSPVPRPLLHGIVQGGMFPDLRKECLEKMIALDFDGYSIGGLAVDLETRDMWDIVKLCCDMLPENKQRYLMGVGTPDDIIKATQFGVDMFDCVLPTRLARHGNVYIKKQYPVDSNQASVISTHSEPTIGWIEEGEKSHHSDNNYKLINLLNSKYRTDPEVIDQHCGCYACQKGDGFSKAYISHLLRSSEILGLRLTTLHNLFQYLELMRQIKNY